MKITKQHESINFYDSLTGLTILGAASLYPFELIAMA